MTLTKGQSAEHTFSPVAPGQWTITAKAFATSNGKDYVVGESSQTITVKPGQTENAAITITEKTGEGTITFNILDSDHVLQSLTATVATDLEMSSPTAKIELEYDNDNKIWAGSTSLEKGFYAVKIANEDNTVFTMDSVRIYAGITTVYSAKYNGEILDVTITDQIVPTPDLSLTVTPSESVASNGKIEAVASVSNLENPTYAWYVNGAKVEGDANKLVYSLDGKGFSGDQVLQVTVFVTQDSVIWSESRELTVTEAVTLPDDGEISITTNEMTYGKESRLTYSGEFAEGVELKWSVNGEAIEGDSYTPNTIGKNVPIILTATLDGVSKDYASTVAISPVVNVSTTASQVPVNAIIDVVADVKAPEGYVLTITANNQEVTYKNDKVTLENISAGDVLLGWKLSFNEENWTGNFADTVKVVASEESEAPTGRDDVGGLSDDEKLAFIENLLAELQGAAESEETYTVIDGNVNLTRTLKKTVQGFDFSGFKTMSNIFWGTLTEDTAELTVQDSSNKVFTISKTNGTYELNGIELVIIPTVAPDVNTADNADFGGSTSEEKLLFIQSVLQVLIQEPVTNRMDIVDNQDGTYTYTMTGHKAGDYIFWGEGKITADNQVISAEVTIQQADDVFEVTCSNGVFSLNGIKCLPEETELTSPVEPTESFVDSGIRADQSENDLLEFLSLNFSSPGYPMMILSSNITELDKEVGNYYLKISNGEARIELINDYALSGPDKEQIMVKKGSFIASYMNDGSNVSEIRFILNNIEYTFLEDAINGQIVKQGDVIVDDPIIKGIANDVSGMMGAEASMLIFTPEVIGDYLGIDLPFNQNMIMKIDSFTLDMSSPDGDIENIDMNYLVSMKDLPVYEQTGESHQLSSPGLRVTVQVGDFGNTGKKRIHGPVTIDGESYYFDVIDTPAGRSGGIRVDGVWKSFN